MTYVESIKLLTAKNIELSNYIIVLLMHLDGGMFFTSAQLSKLANKRIEKTILPNGIISLEVVEVKPDDSALCHDAPWAK